MLNETIGRYPAGRADPKAVADRRRSTAGTPRRSVGRPHRWSTWLVAGALVAALGVGAATARMLHDGSGDHHRLHRGGCREHPPVW
ncbi:MAG: hypothetical protein M5U19_08265 [Microthrixaceae bacterium]|nr:hypothetical protein [Microthrixaceae bacterium]